MKMAKILSVLLLSLGFQATAHAFFIDFEDGTDGADINDIVGVSFEDAFGNAARYGDSRTGTYNTTSDDLGYGGGGYHHNGNMWLWAGPTADAQGVKVDFTNNDGTWFTTGYAVNLTNFYVDAYLTDGSMVSSVGATNYGSAMGYVTVNATAGTFIDYIVLHDTGNYWLVDDMSGDASGVGQVPEPASLALLGLGMVGLGFMRRRQNT